MSLPPDASLDEVKVSIREAYSNPSVAGFDFTPVPHDDT